VKGEIWDFKVFQILGSDVPVCVVLVSGSVWGDGEGKVDLSSWRGVVRASRRG
jgi:hypothetical protein